MQFQVAIWKRWPSYGFPITEDEVEASSAFAAVEQVMRAHRSRQAGHVAALAEDGSIQYRAYRVWLVMQAEGIQMEQAEQMDLWASAEEGAESGWPTRPLTLNDLLFAWGQARGFPELQWPIPESHGLYGITPAGEESWVQAREKGRPEYVRAAYWAAMRQGRA